MRCRTGSMFGDLPSIYVTRAGGFLEWEGAAFGQFRLHPVLYLIVGARFRSSHQIKMETAIDADPDQTRQPLQHQHADPGLDYELMEEERVLTWHNFR